mmetsp:Transcript_1713/g.2740  ORF Transcript_1713/g.2740 Transcript_1713/m.2740 type:complete len:230 (+) Transcript_1713:28-717(+)
MLVLRFEIKVAIMLLFKMISSSKSSYTRFAETGGKFRQYGINIRLANKEDIRSISKCNIENLPENYSDWFYTDHLSKWPELSIIAEDTENELVGYALGRLETSVVMNPQNKVYRPTKIGHIASVAVNKKFRGMGIAQGMMGTLHQSFAGNHGVDSASLYCRVSNEAAIGLYTRTFSYRCDKIIPSYYPDGESAWVMSVSGLLMKEQQRLLIRNNANADAMESNTLSSSS